MRMINPWHVGNMKMMKINLKNVDSSVTKYNPLKAIPVEGSNKARKNAIIIIKIPNLFVFLKLFSLKKNMSNIINIKVEQKIKVYLKMFIFKRTKKT